MTQNQGKSRDTKFAEIREGYRTSILGIRWQSVYTHSWRETRGGGILDFFDSGYVTVSHASSWWAVVLFGSSPSSTQHQSYDGYLEVRRKIIISELFCHCCVVYDMQLCTMICTHMWTVLKLACWLAVRFPFCVFFWCSIFVFIVLA